MFGSRLRCIVCNQYIPDRCTCNKPADKFVPHGIDEYIAKVRAEEKNKQQKG